MANYVSTLTGPQMDAALLDMAEHNSEAWAVGTRDGSAVSSADITYHNNAAYYADQASGAAARAEAAVPPSTAGAVFFDRAQTLSDAQKRQVQANTGATNAPKPNLLDNAWFLINQRGAVSYSTANEVGVDRWKWQSGSIDPVQWSSSGITCAGMCIIRQDFPDVRWASGEILMCSVLLDNGTILSSRMYADGNLHYVGSSSVSTFRMRLYTGGTGMTFQIMSGTTNTIRAIKVEKNGGESTLRFDRQPEYADELLRCQRYLYVISSRTGALSQVGPAIRWSSTTFRVSFPLPTHLYTTPTVSIDDVSALKLYWQSSTAYACTSMTNTNTNTLTAITLTVTCSGVSSSAQVAQFAVQAGHILIVSAEL